jgi:site-specific DNA recombinase
MDRFTRSAARGLADLEALEAAGKTVVFVKEAVDTSTPSGRLFRTMLAAFAEFERETIRERNMSGRFAKAQRGDWANGPTPFGYEWNKQRLRLETYQPEADTIRRAFELRLQGISPYKIAERLTYEGYQLRNPAARIGRSQVYRWIGQTYYRGDPYVVHLRSGSSAPAIRFEYETEAIVSPEDWLAAQHTPTRNAGRTHPYALLGRVLHEHSDGPVKVYGAMYQNGSRRYRCGSSHRGRCEGMGVISGKRQTSLPADHLESAVLLWALDFIEAGMAPDWLGTQSTPRGPHWEPLDDPEMLLSDLKALPAKRDRWLETYAEGLITKAERDERLAALEDEEADLEARLRATLPPPSADPPAEPLPRGEQGWIEDLRAAALQTPLDPATITEIAALAEDLNIAVSITYGPEIAITADLPDRP